MARILGPKFFNRDTSEVARDLLGKVLVRNYKGKLLESMIIEVEVYDGFKDKGSHAHNGQTHRNSPMFGPAGVWYVYFTYGVHWMLNIVTREKGYPAAILIRDIAHVKGPGRLTKYMKIDGKLNGLPAKKSSDLWLEDRGINFPDAAIKKGPRIGISYAGPLWAKKKLRLFVDPSYLFFQGKLSEDVD